MLLVSLLGHSKSIPTGGVYGHLAFQHLLVDSTGTYISWKATAIGKNAKSVNDYLEKHYKEDMDDEQTKWLALKGLLEVFEATADTADNVEAVIIKKDGVRRTTKEEMAAMIAKVKEDEKAGKEKKESQ